MQQVELRKKGSTIKLTACVRWLSTLSVIYCIICYIELMV